MLVITIWNRTRTSCYFLIQWAVTICNASILKLFTVHILSAQLISSLFVYSVIYFIISGNDAIHQLANGRNLSLHVTITPLNDSFVSFKTYHQFYVFGEDQNYRLQIANPGNGNLSTSNSNIYLL